MPFRPLTPTAPAPGPTPGFRPIGPAPEKPTLMEDIEQSHARRAETIQAAVDARAGGKQGTFRTLFQVGGQLLGGALDPSIKAVEHATPEIVKQGARSFAKTILPKLGENIQRAGSAIADNKAVQEFAAKDDGAADRDVQAAMEFLNLVPLPGAARAAGKAGTAAVDVTKAAAKKAAEPVTAPFKSSYLPDVDAAFKRRGIKAPVSAITLSPFVQGAEAIAAKGPFNSKIIEGVHAAEKTIEEQTNALVKRITPEKTMSDENIGRTLQEGLRDYEINFKETEEKVYAQFQKKYGKANSTAGNTRAVLQSIVDEQGMDFFKGVDSRMRSMLDTLAGENKEIVDMRRDLEAQGMPEETIQKLISDKQRPLTLAFDELKATRTSVGEQLARDPENTALKRLYGALTEDMKASVEKIDPKQGGPALQKLHADYASGKKKIESQIASSIEQSNPERIAQNLIKRNSADTLRVVKEMVGDKRFEEVSKSFLRQQMDMALTRGKFDVAKLRANLGEYDQATINELLSPEQLKDLEAAVRELEELQMLTDAMKPGKRFSEGSQTAFLQRMSNLSNTPAAIFTALIAGQPAIAVGLLFKNVAESAFAKLFTSETGRKLLTEGLFTKRGATLHDYIGKSKPLFQAPKDTAVPKKAKVPKNLVTNRPQATEKQKAFFARLNGTEDKIHGYDDGEPPYRRDE